jgi:hypothetical protein
MRALRGVVPVLATWLVAAGSCPAQTCEVSPTFSSAWYFPYLLSHSGPSYGPSRCRTAVLPAITPLRGQ